MEILLTDVKVDVYKQGGTITAIKVTHLPTGYVKTLEKKSITVKDRNKLIKELEKEITRLEKDGE